MAKKYNKVGFKNAPNADTPLDAEHLNIMDDGIDELDTWRDGLIVNNLASESTDKALSANQGKLLNDKVTTLNESLSLKNLTSQATIIANSNYTIIGLYVDKTGNQIYISCLITVNSSSVSQIDCINNIPLPIRANYNWFASNVASNVSIGTVVANGKLMLRGGETGKTYQICFSYLASN